MALRLTRRQALTAGAFIVALVLLAGALNQFQLASGLRLESESSEYVPDIREVQPGEPREFRPIRPSTRIISAIVIFLTLNFLVRLVAKKEDRIVVTVLFTVSLALLWLATLFPEGEVQQNPGIDPGDVGYPAGQGGVAVTETLDEEDAVDVTVERPEQTDPIGWLLAAAAAVGVAFILKPTISRLLSNRKREHADRAAFESVERADAALRSGKDVLSVVLRAYEEMLEVYEETRHAGRAWRMTPRELADRLKASGVPEDAADGLTSLFERARYGRITLSQEEEEQAVGHVSAITKALRA